MGGLLILFFTIANNSLAQVDSLQFASPYAVGMDSLFLNARLDSIVQTGIDSAAYPGAQVLFKK